METKIGKIKRRMSRIKGVCYIPVGDSEFAYDAPTAEDIAGVVVPFISDSKNEPASAKLLRYITSGLKRDAKLEATGGLGDTVKKDSAFNLARQGIKNLLESMKKANPNATMAEAGAAWLAIPGMREQLLSEGVVMGDPKEDELASAEAEEDEEDDDES